MIVRLSPLGVTRVVGRVVTRNATTGCPRIAMGGTLILRTQKGAKTAFGLELDQHFQWPSGKIKLGKEEIPLNEIRLVGDQFQFAADPEDTTKTHRLSFTGKVTGNDIQGTVEVTGTDGGKAQKPWRAKRNPFTMKPLDAQK